MDEQTIVPYILVTPGEILYLYYICLIFKLTSFVFAPACCLISTAAHVLCPAGHAHRKADRKATSHESLTWVVILALAFVFIFVIVIALAPVATPTIGDTPEARVAMGRHSCPCFHLCYHLRHRPCPCLCPHHWTDCGLAQFSQLSMAPC